MVERLSADEVSEERLLDCPDQGDRELDSVTLARLLEEVRNDEPTEPHAYNRMHNRHNR